MSRVKYLHNDDDDNPAIIIARLFLRNRRAKNETKFKVNLHNKFQYLCFKVLILLLILLVRIQQFLFQYVSLAIYSPVFGFDLPHFVYLCRQALH